MLQRIKKIFGKLLEEKNATYQEGRASYLLVGTCCKCHERHAKMVQHTRNINQGSWRSCDNVPATSCKLLAKDFTTYQERVVSHLKKMLQRIRTSCKLLANRKMLQVSGTSCMLLDEDDTTYQEHQSRFLKKLWQRASNVLQVTCKRFHNVSRTCCKSLEEDVATYQNILQGTWRKKKKNVSGRSCKLLVNRKMLQVSGTSCMLLDEDDTTYQEHQSRFLKKLWQRASNVVQVICWRFHNVSRTCCKSIEEDVTTYQFFFANYLKKKMQRIKKVVQVTC